MKIKQKLKNGETVIGTFVKSNCPSLVEMLSYTDLDFFIIDMEHAPIGYSEMENLIRAAGGTDVIVRVPYVAEENVLHALDSGASGVQLPGIESPEQAEEAIGWGLYFPKGTRGLSLSQRAAAYGFIDKDSYINDKNENTLFSVHIENKEMVERIDEIASLENADVLFIGPMDLSQSYGVPGETGSGQVQDAIEKVLEAAARYGKAVGIFAGNEDAAKKYKDRGVRYIAVSSDMGFCAKGAKEVIKKINE